MKRSSFFLVALTAVLLDVTGLVSVRPSDLAFAKPPDWAPAHGYRRKNKDKTERRDGDETFATRYEEAFWRLDDNGDGRLSRSEWQEGDSLFNRLDRNQDGYVTRAEYSLVDEERGGLITGFVTKIKESVASLWDRLF